MRVYWENIPKLDFRHGILDRGDSMFIPNYEPGSRCFSMRVHHGGYFIYYNDCAIYVGGKVLVADYCRRENLSLEKFDATSEYFGYGRLAACCFRENVLGLKGPLHAMGDDEGFGEMISEGIEHGVVDVYMIGWTQNFLSWGGGGGKVKDGSRIKEKSPTDSREKEKKGKKQLQTTSDLDGLAMSNRYYANLERGMRHMRRKLKSQGQYKKYTSTDPKIPVKEVDGVFYILDDEAESMDDAGPPQPTQPTQPTEEAEMEDLELDYSDEEVWDEICRSAQFEIEEQYAKNMAELDESLKEKIRKGEVVSNGEVKMMDADRKVDLEQMEDGSQKRKFKFFDNPASEPQDVNAESDDGDGEVHASRFVDSEFNVDDDIDLDDLMAAKKDHWNGVEQKCKRRTVDTDESDSEWEETGDDYNSDGLYSHSSSDSDAENFGKERLSLLKRFVKPKDNEDVFFEVYMQFLSRSEFQIACRHHGTVAHRRIRFKRSNRRRCTAHCKGSDNCKWMVSVNYRRSSQSWELTKMMLHHTCAPTYNHRCANYKYLADRYKEELRIMPNMSISQLVDKIKKDLHIDVSRDVANHTRMLALKSIEGDWKEQYAQLKDYCHELRRANPGSTVVLQTVDNTGGVELFRRVYICFEACKKGFVNGCRPLLGMDGCHLTGPQKGILLAAIGLDANDQIFPVAYAIVEIECTSSWLWFLTLLRDDLGIKNTNGWTFLTDKQKGLKNALEELFPQAEHRMCTWHLYKNFKDTYPSLELKEMLWAAAKSTHSNQYERNMERMRKTNRRAYEWLKARNPENWSRAYFKTRSKCDILVNNICECFNRVMLQARDKPIITMLEAIRFYFMDRLQKKRIFISKMKGPLGPKVARKLENCMVESNQWFATHSGSFVFEVKNSSKSQYEVRLEIRTCSCRKWQLTGIPCAHAISAIGHIGEEPLAFVDDYYKKDMYLKAYEYIIYPINGPDLWERSNEPRLLPPKVIKIGGRPPKARKKGAGENMEMKNKKKRKGDVEKASRAGKMGPYKCSECMQIGHTSKKCPQKIGSSSKAPVEPPLQPTSTPVQKKARRVQTCSECKNVGHNKATCPTKISARYQPPVE